MRTPSDFPGGGGKPSYTRNRVTPGRHPFFRQDVTRPPFQINVSLSLARRQYYSSGTECAGQIPPTTPRGDLSRARTPTQASREYPSPCQKDCTGPVKPGADRGFRRIPVSSALGACENWRVAEARHGAPPSGRTQNKTHGTSESQVIDTVKPGWYTVF